MRSNADSRYFWCLLFAISMPLGQVGKAFAENHGVSEAQGVVPGSPAVVPEAVPDEGAPADGYVVITAPYLDLHTGPGRGYPAFHVAEKGEALNLLFERAGWVKVQLKAHRKQRARIEGWVAKEVLLQATVPAAERGQLPAPAKSASWTAGVLAGQLDHAPSVSLRGRWLFSDTFAAVLQVNQTLGEFSELRMGTLGLTHDLFKHNMPAFLPVQPYLNVGGGVVEISPKTTLAEDKKRIEDMVAYGLGVRYAVNPRYQLVVEYQEMRIFTERDNNEEASQWHVGLEVGF